MYQSLQFNASNVAAKSRTPAKSGAGRKDQDGQDSFRDMVSQAAGQPSGQDTVTETGQAAGSAQGQEKPSAGKKDIKGGQASETAANAGVGAQAMQQLFNSAMIAQTTQFLDSKESKQSALQVQNLMQAVDAGHPGRLVEDGQSLANLAPAEESGDGGQELPSDGKGERQILTTMDFTQKESSIMQQAKFQVQIQSQPDQSLGQGASVMKDQPMGTVATSHVEAPMEQEGFQMQANQTQPASDVKEGMNVDAAISLEAPEVKTFENRDLVTVKLGDTTPLDGKQVEKSLGNTIMLKMSNDQKEFDIQLEPQHLGKLHIKISMEEAGVKVMIHCENAKTMQLLSEHTDGIGGMLSQNLNAQKEVAVEVKHEGAYWNQERQDDGQQGDRRQQDQPKKKNQQDSDDFLQQLRLGLVS